MLLWAPGTASPLDGEDVRDGRDIGIAAVYDPLVDGEVLELRRAGEDGFTDRQTDSRWTLTGVAVDGPLKGGRLAALPHQAAFWFARAAFPAETALVTQ